MALQKNPTNIIRGQGLCSGAADIQIFCIAGFQIRRISGLTGKSEQ
jgi:hypothetical protein